MNSDRNYVRQAMNCDLGEGIQSSTALSMMSVSPFFFTRPQKYFGRITRDCVTNVTAWGKFLGNLQILPLSPQVGGCDGRKAATAQDH